MKTKQIFFLLIAISIIGLCIFIYSQKIPYEYQDLQQAIEKKNSEQIITITKNVSLTQKQRKESLYALYRIGESQGICQLLTRSIVKNESLWQETIVFSSDWCSEMLKQKKYTLSN